MAHVDYPYTDFHEMNLDWVIAKMKKLTKEFDAFKVMNNIKFAGTWNISKSYETWSFVDDGQGMGYLSIKPVPAGIGLNNEDYWRLVANYSVIFADFQNRLLTVEKKTLGYVTPQMFKDYAGDDWTDAINAADDYASTNGLELYFPSQIYYVSAIHLKAQKIDGYWNHNTARIICNTPGTALMVDKTGSSNCTIENLELDGNGNADVVIDTSWNDFVGPSLNNVYANIRVIGFTQKGWVAKNNNDTWWRNVQIFGPDKDADYIDLESISEGGPIQIKDCNFLAGKIVLSAQNITIMDTVTCGIVLAGNGWNLFTCIGGYHYKNHISNNVIELTGTSYGMEFIGAHLENDGGNIIAGSGKYTSELISFNNCQVFGSNENIVNMLASDIAIPYFKTIIEFNGGSSNDFVLNNPNPTFWDYSINNATFSNVTNADNYGRLLNKSIKAKDDTLFVGNLKANYVGEVTVPANSSAVIVPTHTYYNGTCGFFILRTGLDGPQVIYGWCQGSNYGGTLTKLVSSAALGGGDITIQYITPSGITIVNSTSVATNVNVAFIGISN